MRTMANAIALISSTSGIAKMSRRKKYMRRYLIAEARRSGEKFIAHYRLDAIRQGFIFERMKTISSWFLIFALIAAFAPRASAQDAATQEQLDKLSGQIQDILDAQAEQGKRIDALEKKISDMQDQLNKPAGNDFASTDDLKKLAEQVQEIDKKRQEDNQKILDALEKLGKSGGGDYRKPDVSPNPTPVNNTPIANGSNPQQGYEYTIAPGNTLSAIAKAYRAQGVKVTVSQILAANPGLSANNLIVGKKIFIPSPQ
jgi:LysM repeat protein